MSSGAPRLAHIRALDGVRGIAVLAVLLFHSQLLAGGYLGVDLFFVLSGFLITSLLLVEGEATGTVALLAFWARRARRLLPALFLVLAATAAYALVFADPTELSQIRVDALATLGYVANWRFIVQHFDYWSLFRRPSPLEHTWSLAIEEQFYLFWPPIVFGILAWGRKRGKARADLARHVWWVSILLAVAGIVIGAWIWTSSRDATRIYYGTDTRAPAVLLGAAFAAWTRWHGHARAGWQRKVLELVGIGGVLFLAVAWSKLDGDRLYTGGLVACSLAGLAVIAAAAHPQRGIIARALSIRPLVALGIISYGVYLWHWPINVLFDAPRTGLDGWPLFGVRSAITLAVATGSYFLVERPIRRGALSGAPIRRMTAALAGVLVAAILVSTAGAAAPSPGTPTAPDPVKAARLARHDGADRVMVVGNSVASALAEDGFAQVKAQPKIAVLNDGLPSCDFPPSSVVREQGTPGGSPPFDCRAPWHSAVAHFDPRVVIVVFGDIHVTEYKFADGWATPCSERYATHYRAALDRAVATLSAHRARVVLTTAAYALFQSPAFYARVRAATRCTNRLIRTFAATHSNVTLVDLNRFLCRDGRNCRERLDGEDLRTDGVHYRGRGAQVVAAWLLDQIGIQAHPSRR